MAKSPFPGMDPYLERHWRDVHAQLIVYAREALQTRLPRELRARIEERVLIESPIHERGVYPDLRIEERRRPSPPSPSPGSATMAAVAEPVVVPLPGDEPATETWIEIVEAGSRQRLVTVIKVLSLANKLPGDGRKLYLQKQRELKEGGVNLVEIDLLRDGEHTILAPLSRIPPSRRTPYMICVWRAEKWDQAELYAFGLRDPLPVIKVPLRPTDGDALLELGPLVDRAYAAGAFDDMDYRTALDPPLDPADESWADDLLKGAGLRP